MPVPGDPAAVTSASCPGFEPSASRPPPAVSPEATAAAVERAGRVFGIVRTMSVQPAVLDASIGLYGAIMKAPGELTLAQREMLATVVSRANDCHY